MDAIVIRNVTKSFKKSAARKELTTLKSELLRLLLRRKRPQRPAAIIPALSGVDLAVPRGKTLGIVGRNGSGKSTLLKLITGIYRPTSGSIEVNGRISALLDLGAGFHPDFTGRENILINGIILGMSRSEVKARVDRIVEFAELGDFIDEPIRTYSSGMYMRLAFAVATHVDPDILIIDEILAVGDEHFGRKSIAKMTEFKQSGKTIILVTHDLDTLQQWCDLAAWIDGGRIRQLGEPREVVAAYRQAVALAETQAGETGTSALSTPGMALPELLPLAQPTTGPASAAGRRWGNFLLELERVQLLDAAGQPAAALDPEAALEIRIDFLAKEDLHDAGFAVTLRRADGLEAYGTSTFAEEVPLPAPLPRRGSLRLRIQRLGFTAGTYTVDVSARTRAGVEYDVHRGLYTFEVRSQSSETGASRPPHRWELEPATGSATSHLG